MIYVIEDIETGEIYFSNSNKYVVKNIFNTLGLKFKKVFHKFKLAEYYTA